jgi:hypothetical protein
VSRRAFLKFCTTLTSLMALPPGMAPAVAQALSKAKRPSVIWLSFQECTGCSESLTRTSAPTLENLILDLVSLDYHHTLQAASGTAAEEAREHAMKEFWGKYLLLVDGSIPGADGGIYGTYAGESFLDILAHGAKGAAAVVAIGSCAAFGGLPERPHFPREHPEHVANRFRPATTYGSRPRASISLSTECSDTCATTISAISFGACRTWLPCMRALPQSGSQTPSYGKVKTLVMLVLSAGRYDRRT